MLTTAPSSFSQRRSEQDPHPKPFPQAGEGAKGKRKDSMQSVGIYEAKTRFSALIELVEQGEEVRITRHGKEVVRMLPVRRRPVISDEQIARELGQIAALQASIAPAAAHEEAAALRKTGRSEAA